MCELFCLYLPGESVYFSLYSINTIIAVHSINTGIPTEPSAWPTARHSYFDTTKNYSRRSVPIGENCGLGRIGVLNLSTWSGVLLNMMDGVKEIVLDVPKEFSQRLGTCCGLEMSKHNGKVALIGSLGILLLTPAVKSSDPYKSATCVPLEQPHNNRGVNIQLSGDGTILGVNTAGSLEIRICNLISGETTDVQVGTSSELSFFSFSHDGEWLATCAKNMEVTMYYVSLPTVTKTEEVRVTVKTEPKAFSLIHDGGEFKMSIAYCDSLGSLVWLNSAELTGPRTRNISLKQMISRLVPNMNPNKGKKKWFKPVNSKIERDVGSYACRFSADGKIGLLMPSASQMLIWDLVLQHKLRVFTCSVDVQPGNNLLRAWKTAMQLHHSSKQEALISRITDISEDAISEASTDCSLQFVEYKSIRIGQLEVKIFACHSCFC